MLQGFGGGLVSFLAGYACRSHCGGLPCQAQLNAPRKTFKMAVIVHSANLHALDNPGVLTSMRPSVGVSVGEKVKETEQGDWSEKKAAWIFGENLTLEVTTEDEILISVTAVLRYDVFLATISTKTCSLGQLRLPVASVLQHLRWEDRDSEGMVFATPQVSFDVVHEGRLNGHLQLSFQSKGAPPAVPALSEASRCCGCGLDPKNVPPLAAARLDSIDGTAPRVPNAPLQGSGEELPENWWWNYLDQAPSNDPFFGADGAMFSHRSQRSEPAQGYAVSGSSSFSPQPKQLMHDCSGGAGATTPCRSSAANSLPIIRCSGSSTVSTKHWSSDISAD